MPCAGLNRYRQLIALFLVTVWLPVTQHCDLEAAGLFGTAECTDCLSTTTCADDDCGVLEAGLYRSANTGVKVPAPAVSSCNVQLTLFVLMLPSFEESAPLPRYLWERPRDWVPIWHVARRATPLSRAPAAGLA